MKRNLEGWTLLTRSMADILPELSADIEVLSDHVVEGRTAAATRATMAENPRNRPLARFDTAALMPSAQTYAAGRYRGTWYWIDGSSVDSAFLRL